MYASLLLFMQNEVTLVLGNPWSSWKSYWNTLILHLRLLVYHYTVYFDFTVYFEFVHFTLTEVHIFPKHSLSVDYRCCPCMLLLMYLRVWNHNLQPSSQLLVV